MNNHYIPVFYTRRWLGNNDKLCVFIRQNGRVIPRNISPRGTGYERGLYSLEGHPPETIDELETKFFTPIDNNAATALDKMPSAGAVDAMGRRTRYSWALFVQSLLLRAPEDITALRNRWERDILSASAADESIYKKIKTSDDPSTLADYLRALPEEEVASDRTDVFKRLVGHRNTLRTIVGMSWFVVDTSAAETQLLTSDRPVIWTRLKDRNGFMAVPIGPNRLWIAINQGMRLAVSSERRLTALSEYVNRSVVQSAVRFVYAQNASQESYISRHFGTLPQKRLLDIAPPFSSLGE